MTGGIQSVPGRTTRFNIEKSWVVCVTCAMEIACEELGPMAEMYKGHGYCERCKTVLLHGERRFIVNVLWSNLTVSELVRLGLHT